MAKAQNKNTGKVGEEVAAEFLGKKGYKILERNWGSKWGEIDLIGQDGEILVFVEVKTKKGENWGRPEQMVNWHKLKQIRRMAEVYIVSRPTSPKASLGARIDVVAVVLNYDGSVGRVDHYEAVY